MNLKNVVVSLSPPREPQLELDLFGSPEVLRTAEIIPFEPRIEWTDIGITKLREGILWQSLRVLADGRAGGEAKQDAVDWLMSDDMHPFSFAYCCAELDYDMVSLREKTLEVVKRNRARMENLQKMLPQARQAQSSISN